MSTQIRYYAWERFKQQGEAIEQWKGQVAAFRVENNFFNELLGMDGEPIEFELKKNQDSQNWRFFTEFNAIWRIPTLNRNNSVIESFLCPSSMTQTSTAQVMRMLASRHLTKFDNMHQNL